MKKDKTEKLRKKINSLKEEKDYEKLGWLFWKGFGTFDKGSNERKLLSKEWNALSKEEQRQCEECV